MSKKCLYCYKELKGEGDFHPKCSKAMFSNAAAPTLDYTMEEMAELAKKIIQNSISVPGVQPKLSLEFIKKSIEESGSGRLTILGALKGNYILKPQNKTFPQMPENEHLTMRMAEICKIPVVTSSLIRLKSGELSYITKRIDRSDGNKKLHMLDMFQITEAFDKYKSSMEKISKALTDHSANTMFDMLSLFEITIFCYITGNNDMHLKNFSMILKNDKWTLAPAYDLLNVNLHIPEDKEETALTLNGKKNKLNKSDFITWGLKYNLTEKQISNSLKKFHKSKSALIKEIEQSFLSEDNKLKYIDLLLSRLTAIH